MPFSLSNMPCIFMQLVNQVLNLFLRKFVTVYFNDIFSHSEEEHIGQQELLTVVIGKTAIYELEEVQPYDT